jgi:hypothetical protein
MERKSPTQATVNISTVSSFEQFNPIDNGNAFITSGWLMQGMHGGLFQANVGTDGSHSAGLAPKTPFHTNGFNGPFEGFADWGMDAILGVHAGTLNSEGYTGSGSVMTAFVHMNAGQTMDFDWQLDDTGSPGTFDHFAFATITHDLQVDDFIPLGGAGTTAGAWNHSSFTAVESRDYYVGFGVVEGLPVYDSQGRPMVDPTENYTQPFMHYQEGQSLLVDHVAVSSAATQII